MKIKYTKLISGGKDDKGFPLPDKTIEISPEDRMVDLLKNIKNNIQFFFWLTMINIVVAVFIFGIL